MMKSKVWRTLEMLISSPAGLSRKELEPAIGTTYVPNQIKKLRDKWGLSIMMNMRYGRDRDGKPCKWGVYHLLDVSKAWELLKKQT